MSFTEQITFKRLWITVSQLFILLANVMLCHQSLHPYLHRRLYSSTCTGKFTKLQALQRFPPIMVSFASTVPDPPVLFSNRARFFSTPIIDISCPLPIRSASLPISIYSKFLVSPVYSTYVLMSKSTKFSSHNFALDIRLYSISFERYRLSNKFRCKIIKLQCI